MGMLSWLFPSEADRLEKAKKLLASDRAADARMELLDNGAPGAAEVLAEAENQLALLNLEAALQYARSGEEQRVHLHLELADDFHHGGLEEQFRETRRSLRTLREEQSEALKAKKREEQARLLAVDPLGLSGGPSHLDPMLSEGMYDRDREEMEARVALLVESYPDALRGTVADLGAPFAGAVLALDDGRADTALQELLALPDEQPLVLYERARCALALGDPAAAARSLRRFAERAGGHHAIGNNHTGVMLSSLLAQTGDPREALRVLRAARAAQPGVGGTLFAQLLSATGDDPEAEKVLAGLIRKHPSDTRLYGMLASVRLKGGHRVPAMAALETALQQGCCTPGKCGYRPPDVGIIRSLAILYLEDGIELERAAELADQAAGLVQKPAWEDLYLAALSAKRSGLADAPKLAQLTMDQAPEVARTRAEQHLG